MTRWIVVSRAAVLPMTLVAGLVAGLLAARAPGVDWRWLVLAVIGIVLAHLANNLMNDLPVLLALGGLYRLGTIWRWFRRPRPEMVLNAARNPGGQRWVVGSRSTTNPS